MVKDGEQITLEQAREDLMGWMDRVGVCFDRPVSMRAMGYAAFPAARFKSPQGAALAVSRLVRTLLNEGALTSAHSTFSSGYYPTGRHGDRFMAREAAP